MMDDKAIQPLVPTDIRNLPLLEIFSRDVSLNKTLALKIDAILSQRLANEIAISTALKEGLTSEALNFHDVVKMHNGAKDSLSDLVKIKQLLGGLPTDTKAVIHTFDKAALLDVVRAVRRERVLRADGGDEPGGGRVAGSDEVMASDEVRDG